MRVCEKCGAMVEETESRCPYCDYVFEQPVTQPSMKQQPAGQQPYQAPVQTAPADKYRGYSMKWYKFLVYFALWFFVAVYVGGGARYLTGTARDQSDRLYSLLPALKTNDMIYGVLLILLAGLAVFAAIKLLQLSAMGPKLLMILYIVSVVLTFAELVALIIITGGNEAVDLDSGSIGAAVLSIVLSCVMLALNYVYFRNRAPIFVN